MKRDRRNKVAKAQWDAIVMAHPRNRKPELKKQLRKIERLFVVAFNKQDLSMCANLAATKKELQEELRSL